jgi:protease-4
MRESIFFSSIRSFFVSFFAIIGLCLGIVPAALLIGSLKSAPSVLLAPETIYTPEIVANADGVRKELSGNVPVILKLNISGVIGTEALNMNSFRTQLMESREGIFEDHPVKALLLHIESPGGTVVDADGIYRAIKAYKAQYKIPVYAYVDGLCASGGMYIAAAADKIYASDVSLIGSIGVISPPIFNFSKTMDKFGVDALTLSAGIGKDDLNSFRPWKENEGVVYQKIIDYYYSHFVNVMTSNRSGLDKTKLIEEYGANIFSASQAKAHGFIDDAGFNLNETLKLLTEAIHVQGDDYLVVQLDKKSWYTELFGKQSPIFKGKIRHEFNFGSDLNPEIMNQFLYLYHPGL